MINTQVLTFYNENDYVTCSTVLSGITRNFETIGASKDRRPFTFQKLHPKLRPRRSRVINTR